MKICFLTPTMGECGGVQRVVAILANELSKHHEITILSMNNLGNVSYYELDSRIELLSYNEFMHSKKRVISRGIRLLFKNKKKRLPCGLSQYLHYPSYLLKKIEGTLKEENYDCIIGVTVYCTVILGLLKDKFLHTKMIGWHHNSFYIYFQTPGRGYYSFQKLSKKALAKLDALVTLTRHDAEQYETWMGLSCKYIYNPMSFQCERKADMTKKTLLFVSRLEIEQKGVDYLVNIAEELFQKRGHSDWKLVIVGGGSGYETVKQWIKEKHLEENVDIVGEQKNVIDYYVNSSVFLSTSRWEGFGVVVTEAMECGLPVVSFKTDGPSEIITDQKDGYLIENYDLKQYADAVETLMIDVELRKKMSQNAQERAKDFYTDRIAEEWEKLIENEVHCNTGSAAKEK